MTENQTVSGIVSQINPWNSGKGFFLNLEGDNTEYYKNGPCKNEVGDSVEMEVRPGTRNFADKTEIVAVGKGAPGTGTPKEKGEVVGEIPNNVFDKGVKVYLDKQALIVEQCALKAACDIVGHLLKRTDKIDVKDIAQTVNFLKRDFVADIIANQEAKK